ncbi:HAD-IA family hydrolase [Thermophilibacter sp.]
MLGALLRVVETTLAKWPDQLMASVGNADTVTFDVFDTLISRRCANPVAVFDLVARKGLSQIDPVTYRRMRIDAERSVRKAASGEVTLEDITSRLVREHPELGVSAQQLMDFEIESEREMTVPYPEMHEVFESARRQYEVALISDMYLRRDVLLDLLERDGYDLRGVPLFVSSDEGVTKRTGALFGIALERLGNPSAREVIHFGDSLLSDCLGARKAGVRAALVRRCVHVA